LGLAKNRVSRALPAAGGGGGSAAIGGALLPVAAEVWVDQRAGPASAKLALAAEVAVAPVGGGAGGAFAAPVAPPTFLALQPGPREAVVRLRQASICSARPGRWERPSAARCPLPLAAALPLAAHAFLRSTARLLCSRSVGCALAHSCTLLCTSPRLAALGGAGTRSVYRGAGDSSAA
jgi:hypothetical protein